ncbi:MAG: LptE family protein [Bacteroidales bacterium]|nr:LPS assembly lipoprotein LptE [Bacteroidales bacterium]MDD4602284.1 LptE family protein [Bacteroidales bacterium]
MKLIKRNFLFFFFLVMVLIVPTSCRVNYTFTGASISANVKTVSISNFVNAASLVVPTLSRTLTEALKDYFTSQTNLTLVDHNGDLNLEGTITQYFVQPVAIQGNETAAMNRLSITVSVKFINRTDPKQNWETPVQFTRYLDYSSSLQLSSVQDGLIAGITEQLVQDIFNKAVVNW